MLFYWLLLLVNLLFAQPAYGCVDVFNTAFPLVEEYRQAERGNAIPVLNVAARRKFIVSFRDGFLVRENKNTLLDTGEFHPAVFVVTLFDDRPRLFAMNDPYLNRDRAETWVKRGNYPEVLARRKLYHSTLAGNQPVFAAGHIVVKDGRIVSIHDQSGHYRPPLWASIRLLDFLQSEGVDLSNAEIRLESIPHIWAEIKVQSENPSDFLWPIPIPANELRALYPSHRQQLSKDELIQLYRDLLKSDAVSNYSRRHLSEELLRNGYPNEFAVDLISDIYLGRSESMMFAHELMLNPQEALAVAAKYSIEQQVLAAISKKEQETN